MTRVAVLDYGFGNVHSAVRALSATGAEVQLTADRQLCLAADGLVVPGVGAFAACMAGLQAVGGPQIVKERLAAGRGVLGICVGHQVMFARGVENGLETAGIGVLLGDVEQLQARPLPHIGWNKVIAPEHSAAFAGVAFEWFYFVHSYAVRQSADASETIQGMRSSGGRQVGYLSQGYQTETSDLVLTWAEHDGDRFIAAVEAGALWSVQFHPEKSGAAGARLLQNWVARL